MATGVGLRLGLGLALGLASATRTAEAQATGTAVAVAVAAATGDPTGAATVGDTDATGDPTGAATVGDGTGTGARVGTGQGASPVGLGTGVGATPGFRPEPELAVGTAAGLPVPADDGLGVPALAEVFAAALCPFAPPAAELPAPFDWQPPQASTSPALPAAAQSAQPVRACLGFRVESMHSS